MAEEKIALQNRVIGLLLRDAREAADKTKTECADALDVSVSTITAYEEGRKAPSLPELEILAYMFDLPVKHFWDQNPQLSREKDLSTLREVLELRHRIIGALLREARENADMSQKDLADVLGCSASTISAYEYGKRSIPLPELKLLAQELGLPLDHFVDREGPIGEWHRREEAWQRFLELPKEVQDFIRQPVNIKYLEVAMKLSDMPAGGLRTIAEGLLDITY